MVKLIISGLGFYFHTYNFFLCKSPSFFLILKHFLKVRFFENSGVFLKKLRCFQNSGFFQNQVSYCLEQCACHIPADHDCWLKENEHDGIDDQMVFICFMLHVPLDGNY